MIRQKFDVIVVGAGPAGAICAYQLAKNGFSILILEKEKLPRDKPCAGSLSIKATKELSFNINSVIEKKISKINIIYKFKHQIVKSSPKSFVYMINRDKFDYFLVQKAKEAGATVLDRQKIKEVKQTDEKVRISTVNQVFAGKILVGADGAKGSTARMINLAPITHCQMALMSKVQLNPQTDIPKDAVVAHIGNLPSGYGWSFPKKDHFNIGVGGEINLGAKIKTYFNQVFNFYQLSSQNRKILGHPLPARLRSTPIFKNRVLLIGDAAGLVNYFTGEGIYYAEKSGKIAAEVITNQLRGKKVNLKEYQKWIDQEILPEIRTSYIFSKVFHLFPFLFFKLLIIDQVFEALVQTLRGEKTYCVLRRKLWPFEPLFWLIEKTI